ncbi:MAG: hypothetical protein IPI49_01835 [Myxococcales bacterium]|nr:hypothetical protein [Myxococcales bacterium]
MRSLLVSALVAWTCVLGAGCDSPSHDNLDKWTRTKKGPDKLRAAVSDASLDPDLSAHAATNLLRKGLEGDARTRLEKLPPARRSAVAEKLVPRLWGLARIEGGDLAVPNGEQATAKDLLVDLRGMVEGAERARIDGYLVDWYTSGYYDARATPGRHPGAEVIRLIGAPASEKLIAMADSIVAKSLAGVDRLRVSDELLLAIGVSGSPASVEYLLKLAKLDVKDKGDKSLGKRAISALYRSYVDPRGLFTVADPAALIPHVQTLVGFASADQDGQVTNDAIALVRATGSPTCIAPLLAVVAYPHEDPQYRLIGASAALACGGPSAIKPVVLALPDAAYEHRNFGGSIWTVIAKSKERAATLSALRDLAAENSKLARWVAIEALAELRSTEDLGVLQTIAADRRKLTGYWGSQSDVSSKERKAEPTLGERARELAATLAAAKGS